MWTRLQSICLSFLVCRPCIGCKRTSRDDTMSSNSLLIIIALLLQEEEEAQDKNKRRRERWAAMSQREREERTRSIPRNSLPEPRHAPWEIAYHSKSDKALITLTGLNHEAFSKLLAEFTPLFHSYSPYSEDGVLKPSTTFAAASVVPVRQARVGLPSEWMLWPPSTLPPCCHSHHHRQFPVGAVLRPDLLVASYCYGRPVCYGLQRRKGEKGMAPALLSCLVNTWSHKMKMVRFGGLAINFAYVLRFLAR